MSGGRGSRLVSWFRRTQTGPLDLHTVLPWAGHLVADGVASGGGVWRRPLPLLS